MTRKINQLVIFLITLLSLLSFAGPATAAAAEIDLFTAPNSVDILENNVDDFMSFVWQMLLSILPPDARTNPSAVSIWNH
jgi:hypothetical protein